MAAHEVTRVDSGAHKVTRRVVVDAAPADVFALVADPHRHPELDGSGTVRDTPVHGPARLSKGASFTVGMKQFGIPYKIKSRVTDFAEDRVVEWRHPLGHRWRWEFEPAPDGGTQVTETFDYTGALSPRVLELTKAPAKNAKGIRATLEALAKRYDH